MTREEICIGLRAIEDNLTEFDALLCDDNKWRDVHEVLFDAMYALLESKWIPVSEKLPENGQYVLCSLSAECGSKHNIIINAFEEGREYWYDGKIEAWMPLPEPYKGGGV